MISDLVVPNSLKNCSKCTSNRLQNDTGIFRVGGTLPVFPYLSVYSVVVTFLGYRSVFCGWGGSYCW